MIPQFDIMERLTKTRDAVCANTEAIAGNIYKDCMDYSSVSREIEPDNEEYCSCAANKMANDFTRRPRLNLRYIRNLRTDSMVMCRDPSKRPVRTSSNPKNENLLSSSPTP
jgi:hypothetical protein